MSATLASLGSETASGVIAGRSRRSWALGIGFLAARPLAIIGIAVLLVWIGVMIFAPAIAPAPPLKQDFSARFASPSRQHPFGTDKLGRDQLARVAYGARIPYRSASW